MVAIISANRSIKETFYYNENKVKQKIATCLMAENYPKRLEQLSEGERLKMLQKLAAINSRTLVNCLHISLNFDPSETLSIKKLKDISIEYMQQLGFGGQPYLVYQHTDVGHPHLHIVTTNIQADSKRIDLNLLAIRKSEPARKDIERRFNLVKAEDQKADPNELKQVHLHKVEYGVLPTKREIANVLGVILNSYKYSSLNELNAVLNLYNVTADRGLKDSRIFKNNGLVYRVIDRGLGTIGKPIKASSFSGKPTLKNLSKRFIKNDFYKVNHAARTKNAIDLVLLKSEIFTLEAFVSCLREEAIDTVFRRNSDHVIYGITYIDHRTKCVFNGSAFGKKYSSNAIQERYSLERNIFKLGLNQLPVVALAYHKNPPNLVHSSVKIIPVKYSDHNYSSNPLTFFLEMLFQPEYTSDYNPYAFNWKRKKKKRKNFTY